MAEELIQCSFLEGQCFYAVEDCPLPSTPEACPRLEQEGGEEENPEIPPPGGPLG